MPQDTIPPRKYQLFSGRLNSCSGDWTITYTYYFDAVGRTVAFQRYSGFFNGCDFGLARETSVYEYAATGSLVLKEYTLTDSDGVPKPTTACQFMYRYPYSIYASWRAYAHAMGLPDAP